MRTEEEIREKKEKVATTIKIAIDEALPDRALKVLRAKYDLLIWVLEEAN